MERPVADYALVTVHSSLEKLGLGLHVLATHPGGVRERLLAAFQQGLYAVGPISLPGSARGMWDEVWKAVTSTRVDNLERSFALSIATLGEAEASDLAERIWTIHSLTIWHSLQPPERLPFT